MNNTCPRCGGALYEVWRHFEEAPQSRPLDESRMIMYAVRVGSEMGNKSLADDEIWSAAPFCPNCSPERCGPASDPVWPRDSYWDK